MKKILFPIVSVLIFSVLIFLLLIIAAEAQSIETNQAASIAAMTLEKTVQAGGGNESNQAAFELGATSGQAAAGVRSLGGQFSLYSGFWTPELLATPTAASVVVGGRVLTAAERGIRNVQVSLTFPSGEIRTVVSNAFGYYRFADVPAGATYVFRVSAKRFQFSQPVQMRNVVGETQDIDFVALAGAEKDVPR